MTTPAEFPPHSNPSAAHPAPGSRSSRRRRTTWWTVGALGALLFLGGIAYGSDLMMSHGKVPRGVTVEGVNIGGMNHDQAESVLRKELGERVRSTVTVTAGDKQSTFDPTLSGLNVDWSGTVATAGNQPLNPWTRLSSFWSTREVGIVSSVDQSALSDTLTRISKDLTVDPTNATLSIDGSGKAASTPAVDGQKVEDATLRTAITDHWLNPGGVAVTPTAVPAGVGQEAIDTATRDVIAKATSGPLQFRGRDNVTAEIAPSDMGRIITFRPEGVAFVPEYNTDEAKNILNGTLSATESPKQDAKIAVGGDGTVTVTSESKDGVSIKWEDTLANLDQKLLNTTQRSVDVAYSEDKASFTTEMARSATFKDVMGEFTTGGFAAASGVNIRRVAQMVDGAVVAPGRTFSLNGYTGPRGTAQGFVPAGVILNGHADTAVGGGISQFATTLYNASYFAGMDDVYHQAHSYYISRYPAGREATVYEGAIDLKFRNPFDVPVMIRTSADSSSVTVRILGVKKVNVQSIPGERTNYTEPNHIELSGDKCSASSGAQGFTTTDTRVVTDLNGAEISRKTTTTKYDPSPVVTCKP